jgi:hypothetical protein
LNLTKIKFQENNWHFFIDGIVEFDKDYEQARIKFHQSLNVWISLRENCFENLSF